MAKKSRDLYSTLMVVLALFMIFLLISAVFFAPVAEFLQGHLGTRRVYPEKAEYTIERRVELRNTGVTMMDYNLTLSQPYNISGNEIQYVDGMDWNIQPNVYRRYGSEWKAWDREIEPSESEEIIVSYDVRTSTVAWDYTAEEAGNVEDVSEQLQERYNKNQWQLDEDRNDDGQDDWMIQPDHPEIEGLAQEIIEDEDNIYDKSKAIYEWIDDNIEYEIGRPGLLPKHAMWVLDSGTGDCDEQSFLYASLARSVGIPAWMELGVLYDRVGERWGGHGWIRTIFVHEDGSEVWVNIDPVNDQFYFRDAMRFTTWVDDGSEDHMGEFYRYIRWRGGSLQVDDNFDNVRMETEGRIVARNGYAIPGFRSWMLVPSVIFSVVIYSVLGRAKKD